VDDLFSPPGNDWQGVSPRLVDQRRLNLVLVGLLSAVVGSLVAWILFSAWVVVGWLVLAVAGLGWGWVFVGRSARSWAYAERAEDLYIKHGITFRQMVAVPYGRMQYVDVHAGPLDQLFKIANLHLHTAAPSTTARIPGLTVEEAARLRDRLTSLGETQAAGL
jgi:membrane protein YdbS with pleckstrin-like domain